MKQGCEWDAFHPPVGGWRILFSVRMEILRYWFRESSHKGKLKFQGDLLNGSMR